MLTTRVALIFVLACLTLPVDAFAREVDAGPSDAPAPEPEVPEPTVPDPPDPARPLTVDIVPASFRQAPSSFRFNLSEGPLARADVDQVVTIEYPAGIRGAAETPAPSAGWRVSRYVPDGAPATVEMVAVATQQVREYMGVRLGVEPFACAGDSQTFSWTVRVTSMTADVDETRVESTACDKLPPRVVHTSGHVLASVRAGAVSLEADLVDEPVRSFAPVYTKVNLTAPDGASRPLVNVTAGVANVSLAAGDGGVWRYHFEAQDAAGNPLRVPEEGDFFLNVTEPIANVTLAGVANGTWFNASPSVAISLSDAGSAASSLNWSVVSVPPEAAPSPSEGVGAANVTFGTGDHTLHVHTTDALGHVRERAPLALRVDTLAPTTTLTLNRTASEEGWVTAPLNVSFAAAFGPSGKRAATWSVNGTAVATAFTSITTEGDHVLAWRAESIAGLVTTGNRTLRVDLTPPAVTLALSGNGTDGLYRGAVLVTADATDARGVIGAREIVIDGVASPYTAPVLVSGHGVHTVAFRATDLAGLVGTNATTFRIDDAAPSVVLHLDGNASRTLVDGQATLGVDLVDDSVTSVACELDGAAVTLPLVVSTAGWHDATCEAVDDAGNPAPVAALRFYVDDEAPLIDDLGDLGATNLPWFADTSSDVAGVAALEARYVDAEGAITAVELDDAFEPAEDVELADGVHTLQLRATDVFGHVSAWEDALSFTLATAAPVVDYATDVEQDAWTANATFAWTLPEHLVVAWVEASVDGADFAPVESPLSLEGDGVRTLALRAVDEAGNVGEETTFLVRLDTTPPDMAELLPPLLYTNAANVTWAPGALADDGAPAHAALLLDGEPVDTLALSEEGVYALLYAAVDEAGNVGPAYTSIITVDRTAPRVVLANVATSARDGRVAWDSEDTSPIVAVGARLTLADGTQAALTDVDATGGSFAGLPEGEHALDVWLTDAAGNVGEPLRRALVVDLTRPAIKLTAPVWTRGTFEAIVDSTDALAGVAQLRLVVVDADGANTTLEANGSQATFTVTPDGDVEVRAIAIDAAGNQVRSGTAIVRRDARSPVIHIGHEAGGGVLATISDDRSTPEAKFRICGDLCTGWQDYDGFLVRPAEGFWLAEFKAEDAAGNVAVKGATFRARTESVSAPVETVETTPEGSTDEEPEETTTVVLDEPLEPETETETEREVEIARVVVTSARREDGKLHVDGPLAFTGDELRSVTFRIANGTAEVAVGGVIPDSRLAAGETLVEVTYEWSDGVTTREWLVVVREDAAPEESIEQTSVTPTPPPQGGAAAKRGAPGVGVLAALAVLALAAAMRRR